MIVTRSAGTGVFTYSIRSDLLKITRDSQVNLNLLASDQSATATGAFLQPNLACRVTMTCFFIALGRRHLDNMHVTVTNNGAVAASAASPRHGKYTASLTTLALA